MNNTALNDFFSKSLPFWGELSDDSKVDLISSVSSAEYQKGAHIHDGAGCSGVIFVRRGCLRVYIMSEEGKDITLYRLMEGDMCMLSASCVISAITFDVFVDAEEDSECLTIAAPAFGAASEKYPSAKIFALETAVSRFSDVMWVMQQILFMSMDKRLAIFLVDESARLGSDTLELTHEQIARYVGSAREVVSRMLKYFSSEGIVELSRKGVKIIDKKRLRAIAM